MARRLRQNDEGLIAIGRLTSPGWIQCDSSAPRAPRFPDLGEHRHNRMARRKRPTAPRCHEGY